MSRELHFAGYTLDVDDDGSTTVRRGKIGTVREGDYGCDPLGDGTYRMVPSGEIVNLCEMRRRLNKKEG